MSKTFLKILIITAVVSLSAINSASAGWTEGRHNSAIEFNGTTTYVDGFGAIGNIKTVCFWVKADDITSRKIMDFDGGTHYLEIDASGVIQAQGFTSPTIYIDGKVSSTLADTNWHHIAVTTDTNVDATSSMKIGKTTISAVDYFFDGTLDDVKIYVYARSPDEILLDYNAGLATHLGPSGKTCSEDPAGCVDYGLVGSWGMDEGTGTTAYDTSDNSNDGTLEGGPRWTTDSSPLAGGGGSLKFDGVDDYVAVASSSDFSSSQGTIEFWIKRNQLGVHEYIFQIYESMFTDSVVIALMSNGMIYVTFEETNVKLITYTDLGHTNDLNYHHIVVTQDGVALKIFVDGNDVAITGDETRFTDFLTSWATQIGRAYSTVASVTINSVRIYNRALSAEEVRYHYNKGGPVGYWKFDEGEGSTAFDSSINRNNGTLTNFNWTASSGWTEGKYGSGLVFDGTNDYVDCGSGSSLDLTNAITVEAWVKPAVDMSVGINQYRIVKRMEYPNSGWHFLYHAEVDQFFFGTFDGTEHSATYDIIPSIGTWYHVAATSDGTNNFIYVNGIAGTFGASGTLTNPTNNLNISGPSSAYTWNGSIDEVRIYSYARTAEEIRMDYNAGVATHFR